MQLLATDTSWKYSKQDAEQCSIKSTALQRTFSCTHLHQISQHTGSRRIHCFRITLAHEMEQVALQTLDLFRICPCVLAMYDGRIERGKHCHNCHLQVNSSSLPKNTCGRFQGQVASALNHSLLL